MEFVEVKLREMRSLSRSNRASHWDVLPVRRVFQDLRALNLKLFALPSNQDF
jgi:hypothetical protein